MALSKLAKFANNCLGDSKVEGITYGDVLCFFFIRTSLGSFNEFHESLAEIDGQEYLTTYQKIEKQVYSVPSLSPNTADVLSHPTLLADTLVAISKYGASKFFNDLLASNVDTIHRRGNDNLAKSVFISTSTAITYPLVDTVDDLEQDYNDKPEYDYNSSVCRKDKETKPKHSVPSCYKKTKTPMMV